jgi:hypothetical protein
VALIEMLDRFVNDLGKVMIVPVETEPDPVIFPH